jgi:hypothetical protein
MLVFGVPAFLSATLAFFGAMSSTPAGLSRITEIIFIVIIYGMIVVNPIATALVTELILLEGSILYYMMPFPSSVGTIPIPSPWIGYTIIYLGISLVLIWLSIYFVKQAEK